MEPGGYCVLYALGRESSAEDSFLSVPFKLAEKETVLLSWDGGQESGTFSIHTIDSVYIPSSIAHGAVYAASEDGNGAFTQAWPSPGASNDTAKAPVEEPVFLTPGGFYQGEAEVALSAPEGLTIRYTLDGSEPTAGSPVYEDPLVLTDPSPSENVYSAGGHYLPGSELPGSKGACR